MSTLFPEKDTDMSDEEIRDPLLEKPEGTGAFQTPKEARDYLQWALKCANAERSKISTTKGDVEQQLRAEIALQEKLHESEMALTALEQSRALADAQQETDAVVQRWEAERTATAQAVERLGMEQRPLPLPWDAVTGEPLPQRQRKSRDRERRK